MLKKKTNNATNRDEPKQFVVAVQYCKLDHPSWFVQDLDSTQRKPSSQSRSCAQREEHPKKSKLKLPDVVVTPAQYLNVADSGGAVVADVSSSCIESSIGTYPALMSCENEESTVTHEVLPDNKATSLSNTLSSEPPIIGMVNSSG